MQTLRRTALPLARATRAFASSAPRRDPFYEIRTVRVLV
jgi:hypothetical protein